LSLFVSFGAAGAVLRELSAIDRELLLFLAELPVADRHVVALAALEWDGRAPGDFALALRSTPLKRIVAALPGEAPAGALGLLRRVAPPVRTRRFYRDLLELARDPKAALCLRMTPRLTPRLVRRLAAIEPGLRVPGLAEALRGNDDIARFRYAVTAVRRLRPELRDRDLAEWLARIEPKREVLHRFRTLIERAPLPAAWPGTERLRLLGSAEEIRRVGGEFKNCFARRMVAPALRGTCALYRWHGDEPAVASIVVDPFVGRLLDQIAGPENRTVAKRTRAAIVADCAAAGIPEAPPWRGFLVGGDYDALD
jgi:hypothetical protein